MVARWGMKGPIFVRYGAAGELYSCEWRAAVTSGQTYLIPVPQRIIQAVRQNTLVTICRCPVGLVAPSVGHHATHTGLDAPAACWFRLITADFQLPTSLTSANLTTIGGSTSGHPAYLDENSQSLMKIVCAGNRKSRGERY